jgi:hypothetical protein
MKPIESGKKIDPIPPANIGGPKSSSNSQSSNAASSLEPEIPTEYLAALAALNTSEDSIVESLKQPIAKLAANFKLKKDALLADEKSDLTDDDLKDYYLHVKSSLNENEQGQLDKLVEDFSAKPLKELKGFELMKALRKNNGAQIGDRVLGEIQEAVLKDSNFPQDLRARLKQEVKKYFGSFAQRERVPLFLIDELQEELELVLKEAIEELGDKRFSVLGHGAFGVVAKVEDQDFQAILKLPMTVEGTEYHEDFEQELDALRSYQERKQYPLVEIPELIYDKDGNEVAQRGVYMLKKLQGTISLIEANQKTSLEHSGELADPDRDWSGIDSYIEVGLSDDFLSQYTRFFMDYAQAGISMDDLRYYNYFYRPENQSISFFEIGFNKELPHMIERRDINKVHPLGAAIFSMMSHVYLFEPKHGYPQRLNENIAHRAKQDFGIDDIYDQRFKQIQKVVEDLVASDDNALTRDDLKSELEFLQNPGSIYFELTNRGQNYIDQWLTTL